MKEEVEVKLFQWSGSNYRNAGRFFSELSLVIYHYLFRFEKIEMFPEVMLLIG